jgi:GT2 family glycosyltransferase
MAPPVLIARQCSGGTSLAAVPRTAVILVNTNEGRFMPKVLGALAEQTVAPARTIVADNDSTDGSPDLIRERFPDVEVLEMGYNAGFSAANNAAVRAADGCDWVVLLNPDAFPEPGWIEALERATAEHPDAAVLASRMMRVHDPDEIDGAGDSMHVSGLTWRRFHGHKLADEPRALIPCETFSACGGAAMYDRDAWLALGGLDEGFYAYLEDLDMAFRLRLLGRTVRYVPDAVVHHVGSATTGIESEYTLYHSSRNLIWNWVKNMPGPLVWLYLPQHLLVNLLDIVWFTARGRGGPVLRGKRDALLGLRPILAQRRRLQAERRAGTDVRRTMDRGAGRFLELARRAAGRS